MLKYITQRQTQQKNTNPIQRKYITVYYIALAENAN